MPKKADLSLRAKALGFRSGFEMQVADELKMLGWKFEYEHPVYCCFNYYKTVRNGKILLPNGEIQDSGKGEKVVQVATYTVDFCIMNKKEPWYIETKGYFKPPDMAKQKRVAAQYPKADIRLLFQYDHKIPGKKGMRYSHWCQENSIRYGFIRKINGNQFRYIPEEWM